MNSAEYPAGNLPRLAARPSWRRILIGLLFFMCVALATGAAEPDVAPLEVRATSPEADSTAGSAANSAAVQIAGSTNNPTSGVGLAVPDVGGSVLRMLGSLAFVLALFMAAAWAYRNWGRLGPRHRAMSKLAVLEAKSLGQRHALYVVGYEQQRLLLAASPAGVSLISHLPEAESAGVSADAKVPPAEPALARVAPAGPRFAESLAELLGERR